VLAGGGRNYFGLPAAASALLGGRLAVALLEVGKDNCRDELLLAGFVKLDRDVLFAAGKYGAEAELGMLHLSALRIR